MAAKTDDREPECWNMDLALVAHEPWVRNLGMELAQPHSPEVDDAACASLLDLQHGVCAICAFMPRSRRGWESLVRDHDHDTGLIRGWLCQPCNSAEGRTPNPETRAGRYRERNPANILGWKITYYKHGSKYYIPPTGGRIRALRDDLIEVAALQELGYEGLFDQDALMTAIVALNALSKDTPKAPPGLCRSMNHTRLHDPRFVERLDFYKRDVLDLYAADRERVDD